MGTHLGRISAHSMIVSVIAAGLLACTPLSPHEQSAISVSPAALLAATSSPAPTAQTEGYITEATAVDIARGIAQHGEHYMGGAATPPTNLHAELGSFATAQQRLVAQGWPSNVAEPSDRIVWFVTMEGTWRLIGGPPAPLTPVPTDPPQDFHYFVVFLDAKMGEEVGFVWR
jgi:hypothetical protein